MKGKYISIQRIFANLGDFIQSRGVPEIDVINWTAKALDFMKFETVFQPHVKYETVSNYQAPLPRYMHAIVQIARNNEWVGTTTTVASGESSDSDQQVDIPVVIDANGMPVNAYELAYYRPFADFDGEVFTSGGFALKQYQFTPVRLANHHFFGSSVCHEPDFDGIYNTC